MPGLRRTHPTSRGGSSTWTDTSTSPFARHTSRRDALRRPACSWRHSPSTSHGAEGSSTPCTLTSWRRLRRGRMARRAGIAGFRTRCQRRAATGTCARSRSTAARYCRSWWSLFLLGAAGLSGLPSAQLTETERQVLRLVCQNKSNAEIGELLNIKLSTVKTHVSHILAKLGVSRRSQAASEARRLRLV